MLLLAPRQRWTKYNGYCYFLRHSLLNIQNSFYCRRTVISYEWFWWITLRLVSWSNDLLSLDSFNHTLRMNCMQWILLLLFHSMSCWITYWIIQDIFLCRKIFVGYEHFLDSLIWLVSSSNDLWTLVSLITPLERWTVCNAYYVYTITASEFWVNSKSYLRNNPHKCGICCWRFVSQNGLEDHSRKTHWQWQFW